MELKIIHLYPDLMDLYGSYANVSVLKRYLERAGFAVTVEAAAPGGEANLSGADFLFMGAFTEQATYATGRGRFSYVYSKDFNRDVEL